MEPELLGKIAANSPGVVALIIVVLLFLKSQKQYLDQIKDMGDTCHARTQENQKAFQQQITEFGDRHEKLADGYHTAMHEFGTAIGKNGEILTRMEATLRDRK